MAASLYDLTDPSFSDENEKDDLDSLPSISTDEIYSDTESDAQEEWERSLEQVQQLLTMIIVPWMGKYFGRKFAYWSWTKYMHWAHNVEVKWTDKGAFRAIGAVEAARSL